MRVDEVMTSEVVSVTRDSSVTVAAEILSVRGFSALPVVDGNRLVGIVTEADILGAVGGQRLGSEPADKRPGPGTVGEVMNEAVTTVDVDAMIEAAIDLMIAHRFRALPVVQGGRLVGIVTRRDLIRAAVLHRPSDHQDRSVFADDTERYRWIAAVQGGTLDVSDFSGTS